MTDVYIVMESGEVDCVFFDQEQALDYAQENGGLYMYTREVIE